MSGKLIMKRKLDKSHQTLCDNVEKEEESSLPSSSSPTLTKHKNQNNLNEHNNEKDESSVKQPENKRIRCDTPPSEPEDLNSPPLPLVTERNRRLLEAIQLKMLELQNELDAFEHDVEAREEYYYYQNDNQQTDQMSEQEAEALGFAMCAQEAMLFLQREGIPSDSLLCTRLRDALVGRSQPDRELQL